MILNKSKNTVYNLISSGISKVFMVLLPFVCRTVLIKKLGIDYLGITSLFSSILSVLSLAELGIGSALVYSMYEPIAKDNHEEICALINLYKKYYRFIGLFVLVAGIAILPFLEKLIDGDVPADVDIRIVFAVYILNTVISYWMFEYKASLFIAFQKEYYLNIYRTIISCLGYLVQIGILFFISDYYLYIMILPFVTIFSNIVVFFAYKKKYSEYVPHGKISGEVERKIRKSVYGIFIGKLNDVARNSFDSIILSAFLGLAVVARYNNYFYIVNTISSFLILIHSAMVPGVGNGLILDSEEKNYNDFEKILFIYMWFSGWCTCCILCLINPFMKLWVGSDNTYGIYIAILMSVYFYVLKLGDILSIYKSAKGIWWEERWKTIAESAGNIILNILLVKIYGIYGVIVATIITVVFINFTWGAQIGFKYCFQSFSVKKYYIKHLIYAICTIAISTFTYWIVSFIGDGGIVIFLGKCIVCCILPNALYYLIYRWSNIYMKSFSWMKNRISRRTH